MVSRKFSSNEPTMFRLTSYCKMSLSLNTYTFSHASVNLNVITVTYSISKVCLPLLNVLLILPLPLLILLIVHLLRPSQMSLKMLKCACYYSIFYQLLFTEERKFRWILPMEKSQPIFSLKVIKFS